MNISAIERQNAIVEFLHKRGRISLNEICALFSISVATARRDLEMLEDQSRVKRVYGGAIVIQRAPEELAAQLRTDHEYLEKKQIARLTAQQINEGETIFMGAGTTVFEIARVLQDWTHLRIITNSLLVTNIFAGRPTFELITVGGSLRHSEMCFIGHITERALTDLRADKAILGTRAIDSEQGLTNDYLPQTTTDRASIAISRHVIIAADHTKCARISAGFVASVSVIRTFITDSGTSPDFIHSLQAKGVEVLIAD